MKTDIIKRDKRKTSTIVADNMKGKNKPKILQNELTNYRYSPEHDRGK